MRIISGSLKGKKIMPIRGKSIRPTTDRVKESIFNIISSMQISKIVPNWSEQVVLDCFCGTGALGIEAVSRGAKAASFIDNSADAIEICRRNISACRIAEKCEIIKTTLPIRGSVVNKLQKTSSYGTVFLDPPYGENLGVITINSLIEKDLVADYCLFVLEEDTKSSELLSDNLIAIEERTYGRTKVSFIKQKQR